MIGTSTTDLCKPLFDIVLAEQIKQNVMKKEIEEIDEQLSVLTLTRFLKFF